MSEREEVFVCWKRHMKDEIDGSYVASIGVRLAYFRIKEMSEKNFWVVRVQSMPMGRQWKKKEMNVKEGQQIFI